MRHLRVQRDPAKTPPGNRVADLRAQALITQPVPELEEHQPQVPLRRRRRPADHRMEMRRERREERRVIQQRVDPGQLLRQPQQLRRQPRLPRRRPIAYRTEHDGLDPFQHKGSRPSSARRPENPRSAARVFHVEVASPDSASPLTLPGNQASIDTTKPLELSLRGAEVGRESLRQPRRRPDEKGSENRIVKQRASG